MKVIQINSLCDTGSTGKLVYYCHKYYLEHGVDSIVLYGRGDTVKDLYSVRVCSELYSKINNLWSRFTGLMYGGLFFSTQKTIEYINIEKPDVVHLQCINGYFINIYKLVDFLKKNKIKTVVTLHAEFMFTANCGHSFECEKWKFGCGNCSDYRKITKSIFKDNTAKSWNLLKKAFDGFDDNVVIASVSPWLQNRAMQSPILSKFKHVTVLNGIDTSTFRYKRVACNETIKNWNEQRMVFFVTPEFSILKDHIKGGYYFIELAKRFPEIRFVVAGPCKSNIKVPDNVTMLGMINNQDCLATYYSLADITLLLSRRETFSMVCAESLCCGTPVVGFKAGAPEMISIKEFSSWVEYGDMNGLVSQVIKMLDLNLKKEEISRIAIEKYDSRVMASQYLSLYKSLLA